MATKSIWDVSGLAVVAVAVLILARGRVVASPAHDIEAAGNFQATLQQQNFFSILTSIEERLRSLDNIYSMQLSQSLETKLEQYSRRLEALDTKIIRLEALVMLNLDKISENISTKNFKDDITKTTMLRKLDTIYEGINHRLWYMERKYDTNMAKIQTKVDATMTRFEKIEENMMARDSDIESEMSDVIFAIDDLKTTCIAIEGKLYNISSATLNFTKSSHKSSQELYVTSRKSMNVLHDNIIETLQYMNNRTLRHFKIGEENNMMLKVMKADLKDDFNNYANKVADMSSYSWKNSDTIENNLKRLETIANSTKTEVQNGMRSLMVQMGKISNKDNVLPSGENPLNDMNNSLKTNFEKILTNQDLFLESCHRLQMDESQIETEISVTLENLINMLEKKMASELKDIKNLEKALKSHDNRVGRNMHQINSNVISLFEKSTLHSELITKDIAKIGNDLEALFSFIQSTSRSGSPLSYSALQYKLSRLESMISELSHYRTQSNLDVRTLNVTGNQYENTITKQIQNISKSISSIDVYLKNTLNEEHLNKMIHKGLCNCTVTTHNKTIKNGEVEIDDEISRLIEEVFGTNPKLTKSNSVVENSETNSSECKQNYRDFIDVRLGVPKNCEATQEKSNKMKKKARKGKKKTHFLDQIDVRGNFDSEENIEYEESEANFESTTLSSSEDLVTEEISTTETTTNINKDAFNTTEAEPIETINDI